MPTPLRLSEKARPDWLQGFLDFTEGTTSPKIFRKWAAIAAIAGALERKVWVRSLGSNLYPNMYIILTGPAGVGKTEMTWRIHDLWSRLEDHHIASTSVTKASLIDELAAADRRWVTHNPTNPVDAFNSLLMSVNELGVLIPAYENEFMNTLTDLWDCKGYSERRRSKGIEIKIPKSQLNLLAGCTPSYLQGTLPEGAWDQGFLSRTMLIYSGDRQLRRLFDEYSFDEGALKALADQLDEIANIYGEIKFAPDAAELMEAFHMSDGGDIKPDHPKLVSYGIRRTVHLLKLCIVMSISRSGELIIRTEDFQRALDYLLEAEAHMPEIFKAMSSGGAGKVMEEAWYFLFKLHAKEKEPILAHRLINFLKEQVPVHNIETTIKMMEQSKMIMPTLTKSGKAYKPLGKQNR